MVTPFVLPAVTVDGIVTVIVGGALGFATWQAVLHTSVTPLYGLPEYPVMPGFARAVPAIERRPTVIAIDIVPARAIALDSNVRSPAENAGSRGCRVAVTPSWRGCHAEEARSPVIFGIRARPRAWHRPC